MVTWEDLDVKALVGGMTGGPDRPEQSLKPCSERDERPANLQNVATGLYERGRLWIDGAVADKDASKPNAEENRPFNSATNIFCWLRSGGRLARRDRRRIPVKPCVALRWKARSAG